MPTRTRIVATLGPASESETTIRDMARAGAGVLRLNGSHNTLQWHASVIDRVRRTAPDLPILLDIPGRKIRTGDLPTPKTFRKGELLHLASGPATGAPVVPVTSDRLPQLCVVGATIFADDGTITFTVTAVEGGIVTVRAEHDGVLGSRKGINVPDADLGPASLTDRDRSMLAFAAEHGVDFVGISFVESAAHVDLVRNHIGDASATRIVSKVESARGLANVTEIVRSSDVVMVDRGDLSVETDVEGVALRQKMIIREAQRFATPVIVATEMLHTMISSGSPTKAEVSDITNAVLDGCAATMLSGETAVGAHPVTTVELMRRVIEAAEHARVAGAMLAESTVEGPSGAIGRAISRLVSELAIDTVIAVTRSGYAARVLSAADIRCPIIAVSDSRTAARGFGILPGVTGVHYPGTFSRADVSHVPAVVEALWRDERIGDDDQILVSALAYPTSGKRMNHIETHHVGELARALGWRRTGRG